MIHLDHATDHIWLMEDKPGFIGLRVDCGDGGVLYFTPEQAKEVVDAFENHFVSTRLACYCDQITCPVCYPPVEAPKEHKEHQLMNHCPDGCVMCKCVKFESVEAVSATPVKACHCGLDACIGVDKLIAPYVCVRELGAKQVSTPLPQQEDPLVSPPPPVAAKPFSRPECRFVFCSRVHRCAVACDYNR